MRTPPAPARMADIPALTSLRAIAALLVFLHHFAGFAPLTSGHNLFEIVSIEGHIGVTIFFVLSGFLLTARYFDSFADKKISIAEYVIKRTARIYPLYYVVFALNFLIPADGNFALMSLPYESLRFPNWLVYLTLTQGYFSQIKFLGIPTAWSLTLEEAFYILLPLILLSILLLQRRLRASRLFSSGAMLVIWGVALYGAGSLFGYVSTQMGITRVGGFLDSPDHILIYTIFGRFFDFASGMFFAFIYRENLIQRLWQEKTGPIIATVLSGIACVGIISSQIAMNLEGGYLLGWKYNFSVAIFSGLLILGLSCTSSILSRLMSFNVLEYLGRISYGLYLTQFMNAHLFTGLLDSTHWASIPTLYLLMNVICVLLYEIIEKPCQKAILARFYKRKHDSQIIAA